MVAPWFNIPRDQADSAGMLAHLHAYFVDADLLYDDEYAALGMSPLFAFVTEEGVVSNHWPAGAVWLQAPGYLLGLTGAGVLATLGIGSADPYGVVVLLGLRTWAMLVMLGTAWIVGRWFAKRTGGAAGVMAGISWIVATPILYYASEAPLRPHLWGAALTLAFVRWWHRGGVGDPTLRATGLGALAGLAAYVRPQLAPLLALALHDAWGESRGRGRRVVLTCLAFAPWPLLHLRVQAWMYGPDLGAYASGVTHHLWHFLLSPYHGALVWTPIVALGLVALVRSAALRERGGWLLLLLVLHQLWLDSGMRDIEPFSVLGTRTWAGGVAFGARKLVDVLPLFLPALLSLTEVARRRGLGRMLAAIVVLLALPSVTLHLAAFVDPHRTTGMVHDWDSFRMLLRLPLDGEAVEAALAQRRIPVAVPAVLVGVIAIPLAIACWRIARFIHSADARTRLGTTVAATLGAALVCHVYIAVLIARSDSLMSESPDRMLEARLRMHPVHEATVKRIAEHHALLRARLGPNAAP